MQEVVFSLVKLIAVQKFVQLIATFVTFVWMMSVCYERFGLSACVFSVRVVFCPVQKDIIMGQLDGSVKRVMLYGVKWNE